MGLDNRLSRMEAALRPARARETASQVWLRSLTDDELATLETLVAARDSGQGLTAMQAAVLDGYQRRYAQYQARET